MPEPKRRQSKQRSRTRRASKRFKAPQLSLDADGTRFIPHRINPQNGMYRGRQVLEIDN